MVPNRQALNVSMMRSSSANNIRSEIRSYSEVQSVCIISLLQQLTEEGHFSKFDSRRRIEEALKDLFQDLRAATLEKDPELSQNSKSSPEQMIAGDEMKMKPYLIEVEYLRVENLRTAGNDLYAMGDLKGAMEMYTKCISLMETIPDGADRKEWRSQLMLLAYSNRAEAHFRLNFLEDALLDAEKALEISPQHVKSLARKGKILEALEHYEESRECFAAAIEEAPRDLSLQKALARCKVNYQQAFNGVFDLTKFYMEGKNATPPTCCNFVGPVEIRKSKGAGGRGLFATQNVKTGDLLMVSNALARAPDKETLVHEVATLCASSRRRLKQVYSLASELQILAEEENQIPSMDLFEPRSELELERAAGIELDLVRIHGIVKVNAITVWDSSPSDESDDKDASGTKYSALWLLPSFMNHSCTPNCVTYNPGREILFVRAGRDISEGEELCIAYFDILKDLETRQLCTVNWPFVCTCPRCTWEYSFPRALNEVRQRLLKVVSKAKSDCLKCLSAERPKVTKDLTCLILSLEKAIETADLELKHKNWIRGSLMDVYLASSRVLVALLEYIDPASRIQVLKVLVDAITALGGGDGICIEIGVMLFEEIEILYGRQSQESRIAESKLLEIFKLYHGKLTRNTFLALVSSHSQSTKRPAEFAVDDNEVWLFMKGLAEALSDVESSLKHSISDFLRLAGDPLFEMD
ncbi:hypothetical protein R1sor_004513 [Riccia sorocarpa]|uniref:SET domain-containing protein n=1 Tax=Riccia sorocarpa TaxID=122646 RepID=A0ABD3HJU6_9MARC